MKKFRITMLYGTYKNYYIKEENLQKAIEKILNGKVKSKKIDQEKHLELFESEVLGE